MDDGLPDDVQNRFGRREVLRGAADHDRQRRIDGAGLASGDRGVDQAESPLGSLGREFGGDVRADAGEVDDQRAGRGVLEYAVLTGEHVLHVRRIGHHHRDDVSACNGFGDGVRGGAARFHQGGGLLRERL